MYSLVGVDGRENKRVWRVNTSVVSDKEIVDVLFGGKFKENYRKLELMMFVRFIFFVLIIKDSFVRGRGRERSGDRQDSLHRIDL